MLSAPAMVAVEEGSVTPSSSTGLECAAAAGAMPVAGRFTPATFPIWVRHPLGAFCRGILGDLALCNRVLCYVSIVIPCNNKGTHAV